MLIVVATYYKKTIKIKPSFSGHPHMWASGQCPAIRNYPHKTSAPFLGDLN